MLSEVIKVWVVASIVLFLPAIALLGWMWDNRDRIRGWLA